MGTHFPRLKELDHANRSAKYPTPWPRPGGGLPRRLHQRVGLRPQRLQGGAGIHRRKAAVAPQWIDAADKRVRSDPADLSRWWSVFNDPVLNDLVYHAYMQNITLKEAGARILQARANLAIARGELFPQTQTSTGSYQRIESASNPNFPNPTKFFDSWNYGFNLAWELDFWGRFRRAVIAAQDQLDYSVEDYDNALVTLIGDVATNYVQMRQTQQQIELAKANVQLQAEVLKIVQARYQQGTTSELDVDQAQSTLSQTQATIPAFEITLRQSQNAICTLLGIPPIDLQARLGQGPIPAAPPEVVVGIPAQLLERRPDIRRAERNAAAYSEQIGIAMTDWYPHISITGTIGGSARAPPNCSRTPPTKAASDRPSPGTSSTTAASSTMSACRTPSSRNNCWSTARPCSPPTRRRRTG